jgi:hypothetical protein
LPLSLFGDPRKPLPPEPFRQRFTPMTVVTQLPAGMFTKCPATNRRYR